MILRVLRNNVLVLPAESSETTPSGLYIPEAARDIASRGTVLNVGGDVTSVSPGDIVVHSKFAGREIELDNQRLVILEEREILWLLKS